MSGYLDMLSEMRQRTGDGKLLLTESNAEPFMVRWGGGYVSGLGK